MQNPNKSFWSRAAEFIFYGNYFYGFCAVIQAIEATVQQRLPLNSFYYYVATFTATVLFYNYPYLRRRLSRGTHPHTVWVIQHYDLLRASQRVFASIFLAIGACFVFQHAKEISEMTALCWFLTVIFPLVAMMYYGIRLRRIGLLKPFIIGFSWAGMVAIYPTLYNCIIEMRQYPITLLGCLLFVKNFMFISVLAMMFDIKDYAIDSQHQLRTIIVKLGLRRAILYVFFPLPLLGVVVFIAYAVSHQFSAVKMTLMMIPFFALLTAGRSLRKRRTLMYYLIVIDGLMVVKGVFGILAMIPG